MIYRLPHDRGNIHRAMYAARQRNLRFETADVDARMVLVDGVRVGVNRSEWTLRAFIRKCNDGFGRREEHAVGAHLGRRVAQRRARRKVELIEIAGEFKYAVIEIESNFSLFQ